MEVTCALARSNPGSGDKEVPFFEFKASPNTRTICQPTERFYVATGTFKVSDMNVDVSQLSLVQTVDFTKKVERAATVSQNHEGRLAVPVFSRA